MYGATCGNRLARSGNSFFDSALVGGSFFIGGNNKRYSVISSYKSSSSSLLRPSYTLEVNLPLIVFVEAFITFSRSLSFFWGIFFLFPPNLSFLHFPRIAIAHRPLKKHTRKIIISSTDETILQFIV